MVLQTLNRRQGSAMPGMPMGVRAEQTGGHGEHTGISLF